MEIENTAKVKTEQNQGEVFEEFVGLQNAFAPDPKQVSGFEERCLCGPDDRDCLGAEQFVVTSPMTEIVLPARYFSNSDESSARYLSNSFGVFFTKLL